MHVVDVQPSTEHVSGVGEFKYFPMNTRVGGFHKKHRTVTIGNAGTVGI